MKNKEKTIKKEGKGEEKEQKRILFLIKKQYLNHYYKGQKINKKYVSHT